MRKIITLALVVIAFALTACAQTQNKESKSMNSKKVLVTFFSRTGENYSVGNISKGNTHIIADMIAAEIGGTTFEIKTKKSYSSDYTTCTQEAKREREANARPEILNDITVEDYDVIFIGYPNWWGDMPMAVYTFIEKHKWQGKTVIPFCTHEGSGLSSTESYVEKACKGATVLDGLAVRGATAQNSQEAAKKSVINWLKKLGLK